MGVHGLTQLPLLCVLLGGALAFGACADRSYQLPTENPSTVATGGYDAGTPPIPPPSSKRGIIVPGDHASGTSRLGPTSSDLDTSTGTTGTRVNPGSSDGH
jgi:hypothetical protein